MVTVMETQIKVEWTRERFSACMDGQVPDSELAGLAAALEAPDGDARECWQMYHLIGDVLRSPDLAQYGRDVQLAERVRASIAAEPVVQIAPAALAINVDQPTYAERPAANDGVFRWKMVAGLASFAAVAAVGWGMLSGVGPQGGSGAQLAQGAAPANGPVLTVAAPAPVTPNGGDLVDPSAPVMLRDARLDELLAAHRQTAGGSAVGGASGFLRNATFEGHGR